MLWFDKSNMGDHPLMSCSDIVKVGVASKKCPNECCLNVYTSAASKLKGDSMMCLQIFLGIPD
ncbi:hypothetical protein BPOR_0106g00090 [Botrytis porri]|uniref:Uncharacterized protein n=1 Tax=Botrytis porri TaxID=87229 RepID=A0A4Z1KYC8_9HELO|nr:hypothetical protein BPOR_0106g00090 [Botrytis porri]